MSYYYISLISLSFSLFLYNRDGQITKVLANELVPGDLVRFSTGDRIPADCRLITVSKKKTICDYANVLSSREVIDYYINIYAGCGSSNR